jgi:glycosyltransferase involved in cell wall biosynthesis
VRYDDNNFAEAILALIENPEGAKLMGQKGLECVKQHRNYKKIADIVEKQYIKMMS